MQGHWKLAAIDDARGPDRPLAWVDDAFTTACRRLGGRAAGADAARRHGAARGLTEAHVERLEAWAAGLRAAPAA